MQIRKFAASAALAAGLMAAAALPAAAAHGFGGGGFGGGHIGGGMGHIGGGMGHIGAHGPYGASRSRRSHRTIWAGPGHFDHGGIAFHDHDHHHGHNHFFVAGFPYYYGGYYYDSGYYGGSCSYLHSRAVRTGSPYWWRRYEDCVD